MEPLCPLLVTAGASPDFACDVSGKRLFIQFISEETTSRLATEARCWMLAGACLTERKEGQTPGPSAFLWKLWDVAACDLSVP